MHFRLMRFQATNRMEDERKLHCGIYMETTSTQINLTSPANPSNIIIRTKCISGTLVIPWQSDRVHGTCRRYNGWYDRLYLHHLVSSLARVSATSSAPLSHMVGICSLVSIEFPKWKANFLLTFGHNRPKCILHIRTNENWTRGYANKLAWTPQRS